MFVMKVLSMAVSFIATLYIARTIGPTNFGQLSYATSFIGIFAFIATLGIDSILYRELIKYPEKKESILGSAFTIKIIAGSIAALTVCTSAYAWSIDDVSKILIFILSGTFIFNSFQIAGYAFQAQTQSKYPSIIAFVITIVLNILKITIIVNGKGVIYLAGTLLLESILYAILYWIIYDKKMQTKMSAWKFDKTIALLILRDSWPLIFSSAFATIYSEIDQILIKHMIDAHAVGIYEAAVRVTEVWYFIPNLLIISLFPAIINAQTTSKEMYTKRLKNFSILLFVLAGLIAITMTFGAHLIINILYGPAFIGGVIILQIYAWSLIGTFLGSLASQYLIAENLRKMSLMINLVPMTINVLLDIIWIPKYGIMGPAYATLIAYSLSPFVLLFFKETRRKVVEIIKI